MNASPVFSVVDIAVMVMIAYGLFRGVKRGLSGELAGLLSVAVALVAGYYFYSPLSQRLDGVSHLTPAAANAVAFLGVVMGSYIVMLVARLLLSKLMEFSFKDRLEKFGGALAGITRSCVVAAIALLVLGMVPSPPLHRVVADESFFGRWVFETLGPVYEDLAEKYPALKLPAEPLTAIEEQGSAESGDEPVSESPDEEPEEPPSDSE